MGEMRVFAAVLVAVLGLLTGCSLEPDGRLRALVKEAGFVHSGSLDCEWGSSSFENEPKAWYGCWDYVPGTVQGVGRAVRSRLDAHGFEVSSQRDVGSVQLTAVRGADTVCVDVLARGFARGRNTVAWEIDIAAGEVFVDIWTTEPRESVGLPAGSRCAALPQFPD